MVLCGNRNSISFDFTEAARVGTWPSFHQLFSLISLSSFKSPSLLFASFHSFLSLSSNSSSSSSRHTLPFTYLLSHFTLAHCPIATIPPSPTPPNNRRCTSFPSHNHDEVFSPLSVLASATHLTTFAFSLASQALMISPSLPSSLLAFTAINLRRRCVSSFAQSFPAMWLLRCSWIIVMARVYVFCFSFDFRFG